MQFIHAVLFACLFVLAALAHGDRLATVNEKERVDVTAKDILEEFCKSDNREKKAECEERIAPESVKHPWHTCVDPTKKFQQNIHQAVVLVCSKLHNPKMMGKLTECLDAQVSVEDFKEHLEILKKCETETGN